MTADTQTRALQQSASAMPRAWGDRNSQNGYISPSATCDRIILTHTTWISRISFSRKFTQSTSVISISKCIPVLLYGLETCPLNKTQTKSLDFVINRLFMKLFNTSDIALVRQRRSNSISHCPALHSNVAARNLCTSFVALTSSRDQAVVYVRYTSNDTALSLYFFLSLPFHYYFCCILLYHMWWIKIFITQCTNMNTDGEHKNPGDSDPPHRGSIVTALTPRESDNDNGK